MKANVVDMQNKAAGEIDLSDAIFGLPERADILHRMVRYQLAKRRAGTHATKQRSDVSGTTAKMYKQKGTGRARHGAARVSQFRKGGIVFGPVVRDHGHDLTKKFRRLALKTALSTKVKEGNLVILDDLKLKAAKTKDAQKALDVLKFESVLFCSDQMIDDAFAKSIANLPHVDALPQIGLNVYDILRHEKLALTKEAVKALEARLA